MKTFLHQFTCGSGSGFHASMSTACVYKFGPNPDKEDSDRSSWSPTADTYANKLLDTFVGGYSSKNACRAFLRVILAKELGNYFLTGVKDESVLPKVKELDKYNWCEGYGYNRLLLPQHVEPTGLYIGAKPKTNNKEVL